MYLFLVLFLVKFATGLTSPRAHGMAFVFSGTWLGIYLAWAVWFSRVKGFHFFDTGAFHMYVSSSDGYLIVSSE